MKQLARSCEFFIVVETNILGMIAEKEKKMALYQATGKK